jgi:hypothetical protein
MKNQLKLVLLLATMLIVGGVATAQTREAHASHHAGLGLAVDRPQANLVVNGNFATDLSAWNPGQGVAQWSSESARADGTGSARLTNNEGGIGIDATVLLQCVPVSPGAHVLQLAVRVPESQAAIGGGHGVAYAYGNDFCGNAPVAGGFFTPLIRTGVWSTRSVSVTVPAGAASVSVRLLAFKDQAGGSFDVLVDSVELDVGSFFRDGFE